jgi:hypothetical protein
MIKWSSSNPALQFPSSGDKVSVSWAIVAQSRVGFGTRNGGVMLENLGTRLIRDIEESALSKA